MRTRAGLPEYFADGRESIQVEYVAGDVEVVFFHLDPERDVVDSLRVVQVPVLGIACL